MLIWIAADALPLTGIYYSTRVFRWTSSFEQQVTFFANQANSLGLCWHRVEKVVHVEWSFDISGCCPRCCLSLFCL